MRTRMLLLGLAGALACRAEAPPPQPSVASVDVGPLAGPVPDAPPTPSSSVHGFLQTVHGQRVLRVWGTPRQMGHAQGLLLHDEIIDVLDGYALDVITPSQLEAASTLYDTVADIAPNLREEAQGVVEGMREAGAARIERLDRDVRATDLLVMGAMTDLVAIGCSSRSAGGRASQVSAGGDPMVVRNLDWDDASALLRNQLIVVYQPSDPQRQPVVSVSFAGYLGCLSCFNEAGVTALFNMGYGDGAASLAQAAGGFAPANLLLRDLLERTDVDGDGTSRADDIEFGLRAASHAGSFIVHVVEPNTEQPARVLEVESDGVHVRHPGLAGADTVLAATNHLRGKDGPQSCRRYDTIERTSRARGHRWDADALWALAREVRLSEVVHTLLVQPRTRTLRVWFRQPGERARTSAPGVEFGWDTLVRVPSSP